MHVIRHPEKGLTLIEVLVALAILSIALMAVIKAASQNIKNTLYLQNKAIAMWVGTDVINNIRAGVIKLPSSADQLSDNNLTLDQHWTWKAKISATPNPHIKQIAVDVYHEPDNHSFAHLESYLYGG